MSGDIIEIIKRCDICNKEHETRYELILHGTEDFYNMEVCDKCYDLYSNDYFSPEMIDDLVGLYRGDDY